MLSFSGSLKVLVAVQACDLRKGFNGLQGLVSERLGQDLRSEALFVSSNRTPKTNPKKTSNESQQP